MTFAVLPAGGLSRRMGRPKLALPLGDATVLEQVIRTLRRAEVATVLVVLGPHVAELSGLAIAAGAEVSVLPVATPDMRATIEHGLHWLEQHHQPQPDDDWLLVPADHPTLSVEVVRTLRAARECHAERSIFIPTFEGRRGHPALVAWRHVAGMRQLPIGLGLNVFFRQQTEVTLEVPVASAAVLADLDTPEDYERLLHDWRPINL
ncbi:MAG: nucleotidyltransferase family protein [Planctomycetia bacterium]|nr:nucleotidyltransferase family protein [Planctomycetia bacterium]